MNVIENTIINEPINCFEIRMTPYFYDIIGYSSPIFYFFYPNRLLIFSFSISFILYGILNLIFDFFTCDFDFENKNLPIISNLKFYYFFILNKKCLCIRDISSGNILHKKIVIIVSTSFNENYYLNKLLYIIFLLGITRKTYINIDTSIMMMKHTNPFY